MNHLSLQQMPRRLYGAACTHIFGDAMCGYDRVAGKNALGTPTGNGQATITTAAGTTQGLITCTATVPTLYNEGTITGATGDNTTLLPGCDHTTATCNATFQNLLRFGGFPYIPPPEVAV